MAKDQPEPLEPLELETEYFIKQITEGLYRDQWVIYSKTKYGDKWFMNYYAKAQAISAAKMHSLLLNKEEVNYL